MGGEGRYTIEQPRREKVQVIDKQVIIAGTGQVGLGQRFAQDVKDGWGEGGGKGSFVGKSVIDVGCGLSRRAIEGFRQTGLCSVEFGALVAFPHKGKPALVEFASGDFQPEIKTGTNWYVSMGAGQPVADPLLGLVREAFWGDSPPDIRGGIFAAAMVLKLGCAMAPLGVSDPIQMAILIKNRKGNYYAKRIDDAGLREHIESAENAVKYFGEYADILLGWDTDRRGLPQGPG